MDFVGVWVWVLCVSEWCCHMDTMGAGVCVVCALWVYGCVCVGDVVWFLWVYGVYGLYGLCGCCR